MKLYNKTDQLLKTTQFCIQDLPDGASKPFSLATHTNPGTDPGCAILRVHEAKGVETGASELAALEEKLGWRFRDPALVERALTHASYANERGPCLDQEPLALIGDAALGLVVAEQLVGEFPEAPVGVLTPRRAAIVSGANLARWGTQLGLGAMLRLGRGEDLTGGRARESILATTLEAMLGVLYLEGGVRAVRAAVDRLAGDPPS